MTKDEAMKLALEALETGKPMFDAYWGGNQHDKAITVLREALAEQPAQQEPVAWVVEDQYGERLEWAEVAHIGWGWKKLPLYTSPPAQRKPLTETEIRTLRCDLAGTLDVQYVTFARAIEAAHGIKEKT